MDHTHVMLYGEMIEGKLSPVTKQLLGGGRSLAGKLAEELHLVLIGDQVTESAHEALAFGADKVYTVDNPKLACYQVDLYMKALVTLVEQQKPRYLLFGHTDTGADLGPRLAFRLNTAIATDCVALSVGENGALIRTKPVYGGLAMALYTSEGFPQMATVRPKSMLPLDAGERQGPIIPVAVDLDMPARSTLIEKVTEEPEGVKLEDAEVIVSGGRGIGSREGFKQLEELAMLLKGAVGASRAACDSGWVHTSAQVGITGKIVAPKLYVAVALSGASQHMSGCSRSQRIVAINKDAAAPIFEHAQFGVVGDWKIVLPAFVNKLKTLE